MVCGCFFALSTPLKRSCTLDFCELFVDRGFLNWFLPVFSKKVKKSEIFSRKTLDILPENSIIGLTLERDA